MAATRTAEAETGRLIAAAHMWRERMCGPQSSAADKAAFEAWLAADVRHEEAYDRAVTIWAAYDGLRGDDIAADLMEPSLGEQWVRFKSELAARFKTTRGRLAAGGAITAAFAVCLVALLPLFQTAAPEDVILSRATFASSHGETRTVILADGSEATLGPETQIEIVYDGDSRTVSLSAGAALFDVVSDPARPFIVRTGDLTATALGTIFDVRKSSGVARVAVSEGRVRVGYPLAVDGQAFSMDTKVVLSAGQQVAATEMDGLRAVRPIALDKVGAWQMGSLIYDGAPLAEIVFDVNRYSDASIVLAGDTQALAAMTITASFAANDVGRMLELLALSFPIEIENSDDDRIVIRPKTGL
ncbi:MAG: FecR domain-containing protein [Pseudomonadota bacterium]